MPDPLINFAIMPQMDLSGAYARGAQLKQQEKEQTLLEEERGRKEIIEQRKLKLEQWKQDIEMIKEVGKIDPTGNSAIDLFEQVMKRNQEPNNVENAENGLFNLLDTNKMRENSKQFNDDISKLSETINSGDIKKINTQTMDFARKYPSERGKDILSQIDKLRPKETTQKIPIQSDKIQVAMAELGIDPANPASYTPENISLAGARLRKMEEDERAIRNEQITAPQRAGIAHQLRTELRQDKYVQDFKDVDNKYQVMERAITKAGTKPESYVAVDQALITLYNKMTDPTSVVRESEYARTAENMSVANSILGKLDKWKQGGAGLTDIERNALIEMAREFHKGYAVNYDQIVSDYEQTAKESGIDPKLIGIPYKRKSFTKESQTAEDIITTKSGRKARKNAQGDYEYID